MFDSWALQYCVACEKQVQAESDLYCSESCRLADFETSSTSSSQASSPGFAPASMSSWTTPSRPTPAKFYLSPAYDFSNAQPYGSSVAQTSYMNNYAASKTDQPSTSLPTSATLSPSSSHSSLCSMQSTNSSSESILLSDKARKELRAYAVSFDNVRLQRRRSY